MSFSFQQIFEHMAWADGRALACLADVPLPDTTRLLAHLVAAERVWLLRIRGEDSSTQAIWPQWTLEEIATHARENADAYRRLLEDAPGSALEQIIEYRNSQGVAFRSSMFDILTHVALHGSYHRGQIAAATRAAGGTPVSTDYIVFVRERGVGSR